MNACRMGLAVVGSAFQYAGGLLLLLPHCITTIVGCVRSVVTSTNTGPILVNSENYHYPIGIASASNAVMEKLLEVPLSCVLLRRTSEL